MKQRVETVDRQGLAAIDEERSMTDPQTLFADLLAVHRPCFVNQRSYFYAKRVYLRDEFTAIITGQTMQIKWNNSPHGPG